MTRINYSVHGSTPFQKLLGYNETVLDAWSNLGEVLSSDGCLKADLKEQVRRTLAQGNGCEYCKAKGKPDPFKFDEKTSVAVGFSEVFLKLRGDVPDSSFKVLKEYFSNEEVSELIAFITFTTAQQFFGALMKLEA